MQKIKSRECAMTFTLERTAALVNDFTNDNTYIKRIFDKLANCGVQRFSRLLIRDEVTTTTTTTVTAATGKTEVREELPLQPIRLMQREML